MARLSVRARVTGLATLVVLVVLVAAGVGLVMQQRQALTEALDESLQIRAEELVEVAASREVAPTDLTGLGDDDAVAQVVVDGTVVASSENLRGRDQIVGAPDGGRVRTVRGLPNQDGAVRVVVEGRPGVLVVVGAPLDDVEDSVSALTGALLIALPLVLVTLAAILWWIVGRALRPVESIRAEVAEIGARDLHRRVPVPPADDEVGKLARTMNDMLGRLEDATQRQRRFVADASHELRSPLTRMRAELEVDLAHPDGSDLRSTHESVLEETIHLQHLADDLLRVARVDEGVADGERAPVDLDDVVVRVARRLRADDRVRVDLSAVGAGRVMGDEEQLARLVSNLADNAARHAGSVVSFALATAGDEVVLTVADDGPGVPESDRARIFERFARVDEARRAADGGTGLGLAIARDIAIAHGGTLVLDPEAAGAAFVLTLPASLAE